MCLDNICNAYRFELAKASRVWRQGVPTALVMNQDLHMLQDPAGVQVILTYTAPVWHASLQLHKHQATTEGLHAQSRPRMYHVSFAKAIAF